MEPAMDNEQAKFLLSACQPSGVDADRPEIADALAQAQRDPELAEWLKRERDSDAAIAHQLRAIEPPTTLRAQLIAGGRASRRARNWRAWRSNLGLAATIALAAAVGWWGHSQSRFPSSQRGSPHTSPGSLRDWQERCVGVFANAFFQLDFERPAYEPLSRYLAGRDAPVAGALPFNTAIVRALGCKVLEWRGAKVSLTCFRTDTGELVHLFVAPRSVFTDDALPTGPLRTQVGAYATVTWSRGELAFMVASQLPAEQLERTLETARVTLATSSLACGSLLPL
jgi:hypothetical protein